MGRDEPDRSQQRLAALDCNVGALGGTRSRARRLPHAFGRVFGLDLVLLHAPSVWDFREEVIVQGPLADVIPSTTEFEMYPIGMTSIAAYLEANNYNARLVNIAYRMLRIPASTSRAASPR